MRLVIVLGLLMLGCHSKDDDLLFPLANTSSCGEAIGLRATAPRTTAADGSVDVAGMVVVREGVTIRALYVGTVPVERTEFNYRSWSVRIPPDRVALATREGRVTLSVVAYSSLGCAELSPPLVVIVDGDTPDAGLPVTDAAPPVSDGGASDAGRPDASPDAQDAGG